MLDERQSQPTLTEAERNFKRAAGREFGVDKNTAMRVGGVMAFMAAAEVSRLLTGEGVAEAQFDEDDTPIVPTSTAIMPNQGGVERGGSPTPRPVQAQERNVIPTPTPTHSAEVEAGGVEIAQVSTVPAPTEVPLPTAVPAEEEAQEGVAVAMAPLETLSTSLYGYPQSVDVQPYWGGPAHAELNPDRLEPFIGTDGRFIVPGYYTERPSNLPTVFMGTDQLIERGNNIDGVQVDSDYVVGYVSYVLRLGDPNGEPYDQILYVSFPARYVDANGRVTQEDPANLHYATVAFSSKGTGNAYYAVNEQGQVIPPATTENGGTYVSGNDPDEVRILVGEQHVMTFPSAEGEQQVRAGDPIVVSVVRNVDQMPGAPQILGDHTVPEVIDSLMDADPTNDLGYEFSGTTNEIAKLYYTVILTRASE